MKETLKQSEELLNVSTGAAASLTVEQKCFHTDRRE